MSAIPPIEPARALHPVRRITRRQPEEEEGERRFDSDAEDEATDENDEREGGDDRPHVDVRA